MTRQTTHMTLSHRTRLVALLASTALVHSTAVLLGTAALAQSLPSGGQVAAGSATIGSPSAGALTINQTSGSAVVNWQSFDVGKGNRVTFVQPDANAAILNRVTGQTTSTIAGQINANGQVYLINPNGIAITNSGTVKAGAFVASTLGISDDDFMTGKRSFTGNGSSAPVTNAGTITINRGGYMALIGGTVANSGVITVPMGKAALGSGERATLDLSGDGFLQVAVPTKAGGKQALVDNSGRISARGGTVQLTAAAAKDMARQAVNMSGTIEARGVSGRSGDIVLSGGDGEVAISGKVDASSRRGSGGKVEVTGRKITLANAKINASGKTGGGTVNIGGNRQGKGPLQHAGTLTVDANTVINADAVTTGHGGNVVLWSDDLTRFAGTITAKGGAVSGNGGEVEVSGKAKLSYTGLTDLTAAHGSVGNLLLDPYNVTISTATDSNSSGFTASGNDSIINVNTLTNALATANVTVTTGGFGSAGSQAGDITIAAPLSWNANILRLDAAHSINVASTVTVGGTGSLMLNTNVGGGSGGTIDFGLTAAGFTGKIDFTGTPGTQALFVNMAQRTLIYSLAALQNVNNDLSGNYALATNLNASGQTYITALIAQGYTSPFTGTFEGLGHTIGNLVINKQDTYSGLFAATSGSTISNIGLVGGSVTGSSFVGSLVGRAGSGTTISNAYATSAVAGANQVGGLVGYALTSTISNAYATGAVTGGSNVGGLAGAASQSSFSNSYATGAVTGGASAVGGLVGGLSLSTISNSYATGAVTGGGWVGGLVGYLEGAASTISNSYWDTETSGQTVGIGADFNSQSGNVTGLTTAQLQGTLLPGFDSAIWATGPGLYPYLKGFFPNRIQAVSGTVYADAGVTPLASGRNGAVTVSVIGGNTTLGSATKGANGYYYVVGAAGTIANGQSLVAYTTLNGATGATNAARILASSYTNSTPSQTGVDVWEPVTLLAGITSAATLSASGYNPNGALAIPTGSTLPSFLAGATQTLAATNSTGFTIDRTLDLTTGFGVQTTASGAPLTVANAITIESGATLGLNAAGALTINAPVTLSSGGLTLSSGGIVHFAAPVTVKGAGTVDIEASDYDFGLTNAGFTGSLTYVNADGTPATSDQGGVLKINGQTYQLLYSLAAFDALDGDDAVTSVGNGHLVSGNYAFARDFDGSGTTYLNALIDGYLGYSFDGTLTGLGHAISQLTISSGGVNNNVGLIGILTGTVRDIGINGGTVGSQYSSDLGGLAGSLTTGAQLGFSGQGIVRNAYSTAVVNGLSNVGGLVGYNSYGTISNAWAGGRVTGLATAVGGLVGSSQYGSIGKAHATGAVSAVGQDHVGGLVGQSTQDTLADVYATGVVSGSRIIGGLLGGIEYGSITNAWASGNVIFTDAGLRAGTDVGGLVGNSYNSEITNAWASGTVTGAVTFAGLGPNDFNTGPGNFVGGLVGLSTSDTITGAYATGAVSGVGKVGGLVGSAMGTQISNSYATGDVAGNWYLGGLVGYTGLADPTNTNTNANITNSYATGDVSGLGQYLGGLVGYNIGNITKAYASGAVSGTRDVGGLVGAIPDGRIANAYATGSATASLHDGGLMATFPDCPSCSVGGLVGGLYNSAGTITITNAYATGAVSGPTDAGGLFGRAYGVQAIDSYWNVETTGQTGGAGTVSNNFLAILGTKGLTTAQMQDPFTFINAGWDFGAVWGKSTSGANGGYMMLRSLSSGLYDDYVKIGSASRIYGDANSTITGATLTGFGTGNVSLAWGSAIAGTTNAGTYNYSDPNIVSVTETGSRTAYVDYGGTLTISQRVLNLSGSSTYNGTTSVAATGLSLGNLANGDTLTLTGAGTMADKNVGTGKALSLGTLALGNSINGDGGLASNYTLIGGTDTVDISKATISSISGITALGKTYDGNTTATLNTGGAVFNGIFVGDNLTLGNGINGAFSDRNAGAGKTVTISGLLLNGTDAGNYMLALDTAATTADIDKATISAITGITASGKTYDGSTTATLNTSGAGFTGMVGGDVLTVATSTGAFADKNAGTGKGVNISGLTLGGADAGNYTLASSIATTTADIARATISSISGITANNKTYDGNTTATLNTLGAGFTGMIGGDALTVATSIGTFSDRNAGAGKTVGISGLTLGGTDAGNYDLADTMATTTADISRRVINLSGSRTYNGSVNLDASIFTLSNLVSGETLALLGTGTMADKNAGYGKGVTLASLALGDSIHGDGGLASNYTLVGGADTVDIAKATISAISGITANNKTYDGNTTATLNTLGAGFTGMIGGDALTVATSIGTFSDRNAGAGKAVGISGLTLGGADAGNYDLADTMATTTADISRRVINLSGSRTYNGSADLAASIFTLSNLVSGETLTLSGTGTMADKNAGSGKGVTLASLALGDSIHGDGGLASNYTLVGGADMVDIARATISAISGITAGNKTYDGNTTATLNTSGAGFTGMIGGDALTVATSIGTFSDRNAGAGKTVGISGLTLGGTDAGNYDLADTMATTTADISRRVINLSGSRTYNGSVNLDASIFTLSNLVSGETLTLSGTGTMVDKNAGSGKGMTLASLALGNSINGDGGLASNYTLVGGTDTVDIAKAVISSVGGIIAGNKTYDGATTVALNMSGVVFNGMVAGDTLVLGNGVSGAFADANAGTGKTVAISGLSLAGADAGNYTLASSTATTMANIGQRVITLSGSRIYNGTTVLDNSIFSLSNLVGNETLTLSGTGSMADKNAGSGKAVTRGSLVLGNGGNGGLASNYALGTGTVDIARATISSISGINANGKTYDGNAGAVLNTGGAIFNGKVDGDSLGLGNGYSGLFSDANAGSGKTVTISGLSLAGADAGNYTLASSTATTLANIGQRVITLSGSRIYDGTTVLDNSIFSLSNLVGNETLTLSGTGLMGDKNAGSGKAVTLGLLTLGNGGNGGLASNYTLGTGTVDIARATISSISGITANGKTYDGATTVALDMSGAVFNGMVAGDTLVLGNGVSGAFADANAGTGKTVTISGLSLGGTDAGNYTLASNNATTLANIGQRVVNLSGSRIYNGATDLASTIFSLSNLVGNETLTLSGTGLMADKNVGSGKAVTLRSLVLGNGGNGGLASNYALGTGTVDIARATISSISGITANGKTYDGNAGATLDPSGATFNGIFGNDVLTVSGGLGVFADANAGTGKTVTISGLGLSGADAGNYTLADATGTTLGDIARRAIAVTANGTSRAYGDANPALSYGIGGAGLVTGDSLSGSLATAATTTSNVGTYTISQGTLGNANYAITYSDADLTVTPRAITVVANAESRAYGDANPALTYAIGGAGLVNGDTLSGDLATSAIGTSNVGLYGIRQGTLAASGNYALTFTGADLTVSKRAITVAASNATRIYGDANPVLSYTIGGAGLVNGDGLTGGLATSATGTSGVGSYGIGQGSLAASGNYDLTFVGGTLSVMPRAITVAANGAIRTYGDADSVFTYVATGLVNGDTLAGDLSSAANRFSNVGSYTIGLGTLGNANYAISYTGARLTITPRLISAIANNASRAAGAANPLFSYTIAGGGLVNGDRLFGQLASAADRFSIPGSYAIDQGSLAASANYDLRFVRGVLTVTAAPSSPTADLASAIVPRSYAPDAAPPLPPVPADDYGTFSYTDEGRRVFLTDPRFAGTVVCLGDGTGCVMQAAP